MLILYILLFFLSIAALLIGSDVVTDSSVRIARKSGIGELVTGFLLISVATSIPEMAVSISAVLTGDVSVSIGNLLGSNITNVCLIVGLSVVVAGKGMRIRKREARSLASMLFFSTVVPAILLLPGSRFLVGLILIFFFGYYCYYVLKRKIRYERMKKIERKGLAFDILIFLVGIGIVMFSARFTVTSSVLLSNHLGIDKSVIGATVIALGTSLPELVITLSAGKANHPKLALGNAVGSCLTNLTLILGSVLMISPFVIDISVYTTLISFTIISTMLLRYYLEDGRIGFSESIALLILYFIFILMLLEFSFIGV